MRNPQGIRIAIQFATSRRGVPSAAKLRKWAAASLPKEASVCVRIVGSAESRELNRRWRGKDKPTNVLSFSYSYSSTGRRIPSSTALGDLVICAPVVVREAREQGKTPAEHWAHMVVHGVLHLLGHDHVKNRDAKKMEKREVEILSYFGYQDPYLSR